MPALEPNIENLLVSYRIENPPNPKIGQKYHPAIRIPPTTGDQKNTPKIPEKYPKKYEFRISWVSEGVSEKVFRGVSFLHAAGYFWVSGLSYSAAGQ